MLGIIRLYSPKAKEQVREILTKYLEKYNPEELVDPLLTCVDELVKNGIKANYKYVLIREALEQKIKEGVIEGKIEEILKDRRKFSDLTEKYVPLEEITAYVRTALTQEAKVISLKMKVQKEGRKYTKEEYDTIRSFKELLEVRKKVRRYGVRVQLRVQEIWGALNMEVTNNAPILERDLERIHAKRKEFKEFADRGEETMFFIQHMDDSDGGAGLGYATIDASLRELGIDPFKAISIISVNNTTVIVHIKVSQLSKQDGLNQENQQEKPDPDPDK
ncbi:MAG: hypothetical protein D6767_02035 [Candidatus Hydrogenedentota bacterium]|nr:MAG: hypothetical protein D6767_02035 [Candidatus Hydrogenedentota bacterium]